LSSHVESAAPQLGRGQVAATPVESNYPLLISSCTSCSSRAPSRWDISPRSIASSGLRLQPSPRLVCPRGERGTAARPRSPPPPERGHPVANQKNQAPIAIKRARVARLLLHLRLSRDSWASGIDPSLALLRRDADHRAVVSVHSCLKPILVVPSEEFRPRGGNRTPVDSEQLRAPKDQVSALCTRTISLRRRFRRRESTISHSAGTRGRAQTVRKVTPKLRPNLLAASRLA